MKAISRRHWLIQTGITGAAVATRTGFAASSSGAKAKRKFTMDLTPGAIGVRAAVPELIELAAEFGFESLAPDASWLASLDSAGKAELQTTMQEKRLVWGAAGLPVDFRRDEGTFQAGLKELPKLAEALQKSGVTRMGTWLMPRHDELTYVQNFRQHAQRLRQCVIILNDHGLRFGMEYVGPKTLWASARYSFVHSMAETKDLIGEIGQPNVGFVLDSWHWYTAHETVDDLRTLTSQDIIACDLNDAPAGLEIDQQIDSQRELPSATGVIDLRSFLSVLLELGYDGPVRSEPFNAALNKLENKAACRATANAMKTAFALVGG